MFHLLLSESCIVESERELDSGGTFILHSTTGAICKENKQEMQECMMMGAKMIVLDMDFV